MSACAPECLSANLDELPSVLDAEQVARVLRVRPARVRELSQNGELSRLAYTRVYLFSSDEVRAFERAGTEIHRGRCSRFRS